MKAILTPLILLAAAPAFAQTITVDVTDDVVDFGGAQTVADLPGPDGKTSFREACHAANNTPGAQTIAFAIPNAPPNEWSGGVAILLMDSGVFFLSDDETTVDFSSQSAFTGDTNPNGNEVGIRTTPPLAGAAAVYVAGDRCIVKGLDRVFLHGYGVQIAGNDNRVTGCTISGALFAAVYINGAFNGPPATGNVVGGTAPGEGNVLSAGNSGVRIDGPAASNVVIGNTLTGSFFGAEVRSPTCCPGNEAVNNRIGGPSPAERNVINGAGHYGEEGFPLGGMVEVENSPNTIVEGNYIGVNASGTSVPAGQIGTTGVLARSSRGTVIRNNLIGGILSIGVNHHAGERFGTAVSLLGDCTGSTIEGNVIGSDPTGSIPLVNRSGIGVGSWPGDTPGPIRIGGDLPGQGNSIAFGETTGITVATSVTSVRITRNSIHDNGGLAIDLLGLSGGTGVTPNDPGDGDAGANGLQNFPVLFSVASSPGSTSIAGALDSGPSGSYELEFFANSVCDASGFGEARLFLGAVTVATDTAGLAAFNVTLPVDLPAGWSVAATATEAAAGNTSELSACHGLGDSLVLAVDPLIRGQASSLTATGANPGETVFFLYSLTGTGAGPCPGKLGGLCLDLLAPLRIAGNAAAGAAGAAVLAVPVPASAPLISVHFQAVIRRGPGGLDSIKSNAVSSPILP